MSCVLSARAHGSSIPNEHLGNCGDDCDFYTWVWVKVKPPRGPFTRVPFWVPIFDPQPHVTEISSTSIDAIPVTFTSSDHWEWSIR